MKKLLLTLVMVLMLVFVSCGDDPVDPTPTPEPDVETYTITYKVLNGDTLGTETYELGSNITVPDFKAEEGYYYVATFDDSVLKDVHEDMTLEFQLKEYVKDMNYYIDGELYDAVSYKYHNDSYTPDMDEDEYESYEWVLESKEFDEDSNHYVFTYKLDYVKKTMFDLIYMDDDEVMDLELKQYNSEANTTLPTPEKEGYAFVGWFLSEISLTRYTQIEKGTKGTVTLYARWNEIADHGNFELSSDAVGHFVGVNKELQSNGNYLYTPALPDGLRYTSLYDYNWYTNDAACASLTQWGSFYVSKSGYVKVTARCKADASYVIDGVFKTSINGVEFVETVNYDTVEVVFKGMNGEEIETQTILKGTKAFLPEPPVVEGYAFTGWDHDCYNITADTVITATYSKTASNIFAGKTISVIGDSLSSYFNYIPKGFLSTLSSPLGDVNDTSLTWWGRVADALGASIFINNSYGGTCVGGGDSPCNTDARLKHLVVNGFYADYTFLYIGNNDVAASEKESAKSYYNPTQYEKDYRTMLSKIMALCPNTQIIMFDFTPSNGYGKETQDTYNAIMVKLAKEYDLPLIDMSECDLTNPKGSDYYKYIIDSGHPNAAGCEKLAEHMLKQLFKLQ